MSERASERASEGGREWEGMECFYHLPNLRMKRSLEVMPWLIGTCATHNYVSADWGRDGL